MGRLFAVGGVWMILISSAPSQDSSQSRIPIPADGSATLLLRKVAPIYPPLARQARIQGTVILSIVISTDGEVRDTKLISGHPMLAPAAIDAVKQWEYKRSTAVDHPVEVETIVRVNFRMAEDGHARAARIDSRLQLSVPQFVHVPQGVMEGLLDKKVDPEYPAAAKEKHIEGTVELNVDVDNNGNIGRVELVSGHPLLAPAAMDAVLQWKYQPFVFNGEATAVETTVQVKFMLP